MVEVFRVHLYITTDNRTVASVLAKAPNGDILHGATEPLSKDDRASGLRELIDVMDVVKDHVPNVGPVVVVTETPEDEPHK